MQCLSNTFNEISVKKGEEFVIELENQCGAGFLWHFNVVAGKATDLGLEHSDPVPFDPETTPIGGPVTIRQRFRAEEEGQIVIKAEEKQPFGDHVVITRNTFNITVG